MALYDPYKKRSAFDEDEELPPLLPQQPQQQAQEQPQTQMPGQTIAPPKPRPQQQAAPVPNAGTAPATMPPPPPPVPGFAAPMPVLKQGGAQPVRAPMPVLKAGQDGPAGQQAPVADDMGGLPPAPWQSQDPSQWGAPNPGENLRTWEVPEAERFSANGVPYQQHYESQWDPAAQTWGARRQVMRGAVADQGFGAGNAMDPNALPPLANPLQAGDSAGAQPEMLDAGVRAQSEELDELALTPREDELPPPPWQSSDNGWIVTDRAEPAGASAGQAGPGAILPTNQPQQGAPDPNDPYGAFFDRGEGLLRERMGTFRDDLTRGLSEHMASRGTLGSSIEEGELGQIGSRVQSEYNRGLYDLDSAARSFGLQREGLAEQRAGRIGQEGIQREAMALQRQGMTQDNAYRYAALAQDQQFRELAESARQRGMNMDDAYRWAELQYRQQYGDQQFDLQRQGINNQQLMTLYALLSQFPDLADQLGALGLGNGG